MKDAMRKYAFKNRKIKESYLRKHCDGGSGREAYQASRRDSLQRSREVEKEEVNPGLSLDLHEIVEKEIQWYGKCVQLTEDVVCNTPLSEEEQQAIDIYTKALKEVAPILKEKTMAKAKLGSGSRFKAVEKSAAKSGAENPAAVAAASGMAKYGKGKMEKMAQAGKKKAK